MSPGTGPSLGLIFLPEAPDSRGATLGDGGGGEVDHADGREWGGTEGGNSGLGHARSRLRDSTFKAQLPFKGWVLPN